jgi:RND family efflux transporter MFP subunit
MRKSFILGVIMVIISGTFSYAAPADIASALVQTEALSQHDLSETLSCFGTVNIDPAEVASVNFPRAGQITRLLVSQGEVVKKRMPILQLDTNPLDNASYSQAMSSVDFARSELVRVQSLVAQQLATKSQLAIAEKALSDAETVLAAQQRLGTNTNSELINAPFDGIVIALNVTQGERIQAGATALQLARVDRSHVILGIEPEDVSKVKPGMPVHLTPVFNERLSVSGTINKIHGMINPQTRLIDATVKFERGQTVSLLPGTRVRGLITLTRIKAFAVPRQAVLRDDQGSYIFVVRDGRAHRINVQTGTASHGLVGIDGPSLQGERVVVMGNYELREGMAVRETVK